jgi:hypothetical protein
MDEVLWLFLIHWVFIRNLGTRQVRGDIMKGGFTTF